MKNTKANTNGNQYSFRGATFHISFSELQSAIRESLQLHDRLVDDLVAEAQRHAALIEAARAATPPAVSRRKPNGKVIAEITRK